VEVEDVVRNEQTVLKQELRNSKCHLSQVTINSCPVDTNNETHCITVRTLQHITLLISWPLSLRNNKMSRGRAYENLNAFDSKQAF
jgi:hypothetical protein